MKSKDGERTGEFGLWLRRYLEEDDRYSVYYDHGDREKDPNVGYVKGFFGRQVADKNTLAYLDVMVVDNDNYEVVLLIEIEESKMSPKTLLGDIFAALMSNQFSVGVGSEAKYFDPTSETCLIVAGWVESKGAGQEKIESTIAPRLLKFTAPEGEIQFDQIKFVVGNDIFETIEKLKREMRNLFPMS